MLSALLKLLLSLAAGALCLWQHNARKSIAAVFCFSICVLLLISFILDIIRMIAHRIAASKASGIQVTAPLQEDYPDNPDPTNLKIGKTYRASEVNKYLDNIQKFASPNPDYALSESEIIDCYLTDKKLWELTFRPKKVSLQKLGDHSIGVFSQDLQIGTIAPAECPPLLSAMEEEGVEVVYCTVGGGRYKIIHDDVVTGKFSITEGQTPYSVTLSIYQK